MRALVQRVTSAAVDVVPEDAGGVVRRVGEIGPGLLVLLGVTHDDTEAGAQALARKVHGLRILRDERSLADGARAADPAPPAALVVSQFTLYGDARKGRRPTWAAAAPGPVARPLVEAFCTLLRAHGAEVATGVFGADMRVSLVNDGPMTVLLEV